MKSEVLNIPRVSQECCPYCGLKTSRYKYLDSNNVYPVFLDVYKAVHEQKCYHSWNELYSCIKCKTKFILNRYRIVEIF